MLNTNHPHIAITLNNLAEIYSFKKNYQKSISTYEQALKIYKKAYGADHISVALVFSNLSSVYQDLKNYDKSEFYIKKALEIYKKNSQENSSQYVYNLLSLANLKKLQKKSAEAEELFDRALKLSRKLNTDNNQTLVTSLDSIGVFYGEKGDYKKALDYYEEGLKKTNFYGKLTNNIYDYPIRVLTRSLLRNRADALTGLASQDFSLVNDAFTATELSLAFIERFRKNTIGYENRLIQWENLDLFFERSIRLAKLLEHMEGKLPQESYLFFESALSRNLSEQLSSRFIKPTKQVPKEILQNQENFFKQREELQRKLIEVEDNTLEKEILVEYIQNEKDLAAFIDKLHEKYPSYAQMNYPRPVSLNYVQNELLKKDKIALAYFLGSLQSFILVVTEANTHLITLNLSRDDIYRKIQAFRETALWYEQGEDICKISSKPIKRIKKDTKVLEDVSNSLYNDLITPVSNYLDGKEEIVIIPHSRLWLLPFESLLADSGEYFGANFKISYQNSFTVWKLNHEFLRNKPDNKKLFVGIGDPIYQNDERYTSPNSELIAKTEYKKHQGRSYPEKSEKDESIGSNGLIATRSATVSQELKGCSWQPLRLSKDEINEILNLDAFKNKSDSRLGYLAAEWNFDKLEDFKYVHFSTHGVMQMEVNNREAQRAIVNRCVKRA